MYPQKFLGSNINLVKAHNLQAILLSLLYDQRVSRVELAQKTSLSTTTITNLTAELLEQGIIVEVDGDDTDEHRSVGRPRRLLKLIPDARSAVGVHIGVGLFRVAVTNLHAEIICNNIARYDLSSPAEEILDQIADLVEQTIAQSQVDRECILGIGVGASGLVDHRKGINLVATRLKWRNVHIQSILEARLGYPVCVENNVRTMALGEAFFGAGRDINVLAFVYGRIGVGAGFVVNGSLFRGSGAGAGEIGHTIMLPEGGDVCQCGKRGCLETLVSETVFVKHAQQLAAAHPDSILADYLKAGNSNKPIEKIFSAAREGDTLSIEMINERAEYLGIALANLVNILNPELILLGGMFAQGYDLITPIAETTMRKMSFAGLGEEVRLEETSFGWRAGVIGAAALALTTNFYLQAESA